MITWKELCDRKIPYSFSRGQSVNTIYPIEENRGDVFNSLNNQLFKSELITPLIEGSGELIDENVYFIHYELEPSQLNEAKSCNCSIRNLMIRGCRCGHLKNDRA